MYKVGFKIKEIRIQKKMSQKSLAEKIGVKNTTISNWENGLTRPDVDTLVLICQALGISADELLEIEYSQSSKFHIGSNIKKYRDQKKLSQRELSEKIGVNHKTIVDFENNKRIPNIDEIIKICRALEVDANAIFDFENKKRIIIYNEPHLSAVEKYFDMPEHVQYKIQGMIDAYHNESVMLYRNGVTLYNNAAEMLQSLKKSKK